MDFIHFSTWPDLTIVLDVDIETGFQRLGRKQGPAAKHRRQHAGQHSMFADAVTDAQDATSDFRNCSNRIVSLLIAKLPDCPPAPE